MNRELGCGDERIGFARHASEQKAEGGISLEASRRRVCRPYFTFGAALHAREWSARKVAQLEKDR